MRVVLIIPTYNEKENITVLLEELHRAAAGIKHTIRYLVVDDTSPDGTADTVRAYMKSHSDVSVIVGKKEGLGKAILRGMEYAVDTMDADAVMQMDADLSHDPTKLPLFLAKMDAGADFVVGSRYIPGGSIPDNWGWHRKLYSTVANIFVRFGLGHPEVHDWTGGYRLYDKKYVNALKGEMGNYSGYIFQIAFLHKAVSMGAKVAEVAFHFTDRKYGKSKIYAAEYIRHVLLYVVSARSRELATGSVGKFAVVGAIGFVINTVILVVAVRLGIHPGIGSAVGAEVAIVSNFILNNTWTFRERAVTGGKLVGKFLQFNLTSVGAILLQSGTVWLGTHLFGLAWYFLFYIMGVGLGMVWNYIMYSRVVWKKRN